MLTDSGKLQTLDILLKRLRAGNHRVLLFAQMTKMLNIIEDYMNYRKYRYLRLILYMSATPLPPIHTSFSLETTDTEKLNNLKFAVSGLTLISDIGHWNLERTKTDMEL